MNNSRFMNHVNHDGDCWNWSGPYIGPTPVFSDNSARRFAFIATYDYRPKRQLLVTCENRACVNPAHLTDDKQVSLNAMFDRRITKTDDGCWLWTPQDFKFVHPNGTNPRRFTMLRFYGSIEPWHRFMAICKNDRCVSPEHVYQYDPETLWGYELCRQQHPQIPSNRTMFGRCKLCTKEGNRT